MLMVARVVAQAALLRTESRGAHQREDLPGMLPEWRVNQVARVKAAGSKSRGCRPRLLKLPRNERDSDPENLAGPDKTVGRFESYEVPFELGQSVLDGLRWIRVHKDPTLAFRYSCVNANACKECMMEIDGETIYACTTRLEPRAMTIEPLGNKKLVRDLVTEIAPPQERLRLK